MHRGIILLASLLADSGSGVVEEGKQWLPSTPGTFCTESDDSESYVPCITRAHSFVFAMGVSDGQ